jgi:hypothetical protein
MEYCYIARLDPSRTALQLTMEHCYIARLDPSRMFLLPSRKKVRREVRSGQRPEGSGSGRLVDEYRLIDADTDQYVERIVDIESDTVVRDINERLSDHRGGSEKRTKK